MLTNSCRSVGVRRRASYVRSNKFIQCYCEWTALQHSRSVPAAPFFQTVRGSVARKNMCILSFCLSVWLSWCCTSEYNSHRWINQGQEKQEKVSIYQVMWAENKGRKKGPRVRQRATNDGAVAKMDPEEKCPFRISFLTHYCIHTGFCFVGVLGTFMKAIWDCNLQKKEESPKAKERSHQNGFLLLWRLPLWRYRPSRKWWMIQI